jgi:hypothetical protein
MAEERNEEEQLDPSLFAAEEEQTPQEPQNQAAEQAVDTPDPEADIPEKYRGKDPMALIRMHQDAERLLGKHSNELGELRQVVNDILAAQPSKAPEPEPEEDVDWWDDPNKATESRVRKYSEPLKQELDGVKQKLKELDHKEAAQLLMRRHPDVHEVTQSPEFQKWVGSNKARQRLFHDAHVNYDVEAAVGLLDDWKERQETRQKTSDSAKAQRTQSVRNASTGAGRSSSETRGKPILSREAIIELKRKDPDKYARMLPQIKQAYLEGRTTK